MATWKPLGGQIWEWLQLQARERIGPMAETGADPTQLADAVVRANEHIGDIGSRRDQYQYELSKYVRDYLASFESTP